jgi:hypothetical protein
MQTAKLLRLSCAILLLLLNTACVMKSYSLLEPIKPHIPYITTATVDSLTPKFVWSKSDEPGVTYDFAIFNVTYPHRSFSSPPPPYPQTGQPIYYRTALLTNEHIVEVALNPDTYYAWTVRTRVDNRVSPWSTVTIIAGGPTSSTSRTGYYFPFKTP